MNIIKQYLSCSPNDIEKFKTFLTGSFDKKNPIYYIPFDIKELILKEILHFDKPGSIEEKTDLNTGGKRIVYNWYYTVNIDKMGLKITHRDHDKPSLIDMRKDIIIVSWHIDGCLKRENENDPVIIEYCTNTEAIISKEWIRPHYLPYRIEVGDDDMFICCFRPHNNYNSHQTILYTLEKLPLIYNW